jgi:hypothetical protein
VKKRSDNTLDSDATKTIPAKPEAIEPDPESTKIIEEKTASSTLDSDPVKSVKPKTEVKAAAVEVKKPLNLQKP